MLKEANFEAAIVNDLVAAGYREGDAAGFDAARGLFPDDLYAFLERSQPKEWAALDKALGNNRQPQVLHDLVKDLDYKGALEVLRHGFKVHGVTLRLAFFKPSHSLNPETALRYAQNNLTVTRQVHFDPNGNDSVDLVIGLNGLPVATLELKNALTGQTADHARKQYQKRDPTLPLFRWQKRALVHFAVDTDVVWMTTKLAGGATTFLPFNRGNDGGAGNPSTTDGSYRVAYLWREVLAFDSLLDILARFVALLTESKIVGGKKEESKNLLFPRFHQLDAVRKLEAAARAEGPGKHYLIQHSAGSGKSNTIAWTAHRLAVLHDAQDRKVFDSVIVVTDRRVLDRQLQGTIAQLEHKSGFVQKIDEDSKQLAAALESGTPVIVTTLQKFPFVTEKLAGLPDRSYAVIVDEAHSSQTGEAARSLREALATKKDKEGAKAAPPASAQAAPTDPDAEEPDEPTVEDEIVRVIQSRGRQANVSFFAFTATPKFKTLEVFGRIPPGATATAERKPEPFHLYTMRQAIEEGFILDVLENFTSYATYYKLVSAKEKDRVVKKREAQKALAAYMALHPHNIAQKVRVIADHFRWNIRQRLGGKAKAMVVTRSRLHAVRYKLAFDAYLKESKIEDMRALVAFSGTVFEPDLGASFTEVGMNVDAAGKNISEAELPAKFGSDEFQVLLVANKFQTGFDQPLLVAMYVDRRLSGVQAVQTLSRLNRTCPGKDAVFVLDFVNKPHEIQAAFQPFYNATTIEEGIDPKRLDELAHDLDQGAVWTTELLEGFAKVFYKPKAKLNDTEHAEVLAFLDPAVAAFTELDEDARDAWKGKLGAFVRLYAFVSQTMTYADRDLEIRYSFGRLLQKKLPRTKGDPIHLDGEVDLHSYRLAHVGDTAIKLKADEKGMLAGPTDTGTRGEKDVEVALSTIIDLFNKRFGTDFNEGDRLGLEQIVADSKADESVIQKAKANAFPDFLLGVKEKLLMLLVQRRDRNEKMVSQVLDDDDFQRAVLGYLAQRIFEDARG
ncbi:MAG: type I restriction endonuclease subunit R [Deltaproteobacteria bacterium]|nr:type I restriction endonuclease subunit R [Deltaproteobacteria bacterium]